MRRARLAHGGRDEIVVALDADLLRDLRAVWAAVWFEAACANSPDAGLYREWTEVFNRRQLPNASAKTMRLHRNLAIALGAMTVRQARSLAEDARRLGKSDREARNAELAGWRLFAATKARKGRRTTLSLDESIVLAKQKLDPSNDTRSAEIKRARTRAKNARRAAERFGVLDLYLEAEKACLGQTSE